MAAIATTTTGRIDRRHPCDAADRLWARHGGRVEPLRVNVFEIWRSHEALSAFRESGPDDGLASLITRADVHEYEL